MKSLPLSHLVASQISRRLALFSLGAALALVASPKAHADLIYLNPKGQMKYGKEAGPYYGVIRGANREGILWQPYKKAWEWTPGAAYPVIPHDVLGKVVQSLDSKEDLFRLRAHINSFVNGATAEPSKDYTSGFIVRSILETYTYKTFKNEEADPGLTDALVAELRRLLQCYGAPDSYAQGHPDYARVLARRMAGAEARKNLVQALVVAQRAMKEPHDDLSKDALHPIYIGFVALDFVPDVTWKLTYKENDLRGVHEQVAQCLLDIVSLPSGNLQVIFKARDQLVELCKNSERGREVIVSEFARIDDPYRKAATAWILVDYGRASEEVVGSATRFVLDLIQGQPNPSAKRLDYAREVLFKLMQEHSTARQITMQAADKLRERVAKDLAAKGDHDVLKLLENYHSRLGSPDR